MKLNHPAMLAVLTIGLYSGASIANAESVILGASKPGHAAYNIVVAYSQAIKKDAPSIEPTVQASGGSLEAVQLLQAGRVDAAPMGASAPYAAYRGEGKWEGKPATAVRAWLPMYSWAAQLIVPATSDIKSWSDLRGKRVGVGGIGSAGEGYNKDILAAVGLTYDDIEEYRVPHQEMSDGLKSGLLDAAIITTGYPTPGIMEVMANMDVRFIPNTAEELEKVDASNPLYSAGRIPGGVYPGFDDDLPVVVGYTVMSINERVSEDTAYAMTKAIWENLDDIGASHASQKLLNPDMVKPALAPIAPIHPGALRYYREQGWID